MTEATMEDERCCSGQTREVGDSAGTCPADCPPVGKPATPVVVITSLGFDDVGNESGSIGVLSDVDKHNMLFLVMLVAHET